MAKYEGDSPQIGKLRWGMSNRSSRPSEVVGNAVWCGGDGVVMMVWYSGGGCILKKWVFEGFVTIHYTLNFKFMI